MFGAWGNPDPAESIRIIYRAIDAELNFIGTDDVYSACESEVIVGEAPPSTGPASPPSLSASRTNIFADFPSSLSLTGERSFLDCDHGSDPSFTKVRDSDLS